MRWTLTRVYPARWSQPTKKRQLASCQEARFDKTNRLAPNDNRSDCGARQLRIADHIQSQSLRFEAPRERPDWQFESVVFT
jgi:hypothetical protein